MLDLIFDAASLISDDILPDDSDRKREVTIITSYRKQDVGGVKNLPPLADSSCVRIIDISKQDDFPEDADPATQKTQTRVYKDRIGIIDGRLCAFVRTTFWLNREILVILGDGVRLEIPLGRSRKLVFIFEDTVYIACINTVHKEL